MSSQEKTLAKLKEECRVSSYIKADMNKWLQNPSIDAITEYTGNPALILLHTRDGVIFR